VAGTSDEHVSKGDHVTWESHGGEAEYEVKSEKSGGTAVHKPSALHQD
jgi:hypothetical protein